MTWERGRPRLHVKIYVTTNIVHSWKSYTSHETNKLRNRKKHSGWSNITIDLSETNVTLILRANIRKNPVAAAGLSIRRMIGHGAAQARDKSRNKACLVYRPLFTMQARTPALPCQGNAASPLHWNARLSARLFIYCAGGTARASRSGFLP